MTAPAFELQLALTEAHVAHVAELRELLYVPALHAVHVAPEPDPASTEPAKQEHDSDAPKPEAVNPALHVHVVAPGALLDDAGHGAHVGVMPLTHAQELSTTDCW